MSECPLFSILVANHNDGKVIKDALASVAKQTYNNIEIIIVDDGSTDDSMRILHELENVENVHIFYNDLNRGCGFTKRKCIENANGEICGFLDADDALTPDAVETMVNEHLSHPTTALVYSRYYMCDNRLTPQYVSNHQCKIPEGRTFLDYKRGAISHFVTFKKKYYDMTEGMNPNLRAAEDLDLYFKLEEVGDTLFVDKPLYYYRGNTGKNTTLGNNTVRAAHWEIIAKTDAFRRRSINLHKDGIPLIEEITESISDYKKNCSREYKLGNCLLHPKEIIKTVKRRFK